jgi:hypothetical protein
VSVTFYADESESTGEVFTVAGFMATPSAWQRFIPRWRQMLSDTGPYPVDAFHAADVEAGRPPFDGWSDNARAALVQNALAVIADKSLCQNLYAISCSFVLPDYQLLSKGKKSSIADHYERCYRVVFQNILNRWVYNGIEFVFDNKEKVKGRVQTHFNRAKEQLDKMPLYRGKLESCSFRDDRVAVPLQAADLLAYEVRRRVWERLRNPNAPVRNAYQRIKDSFAVRQTAGPYRERLFRCYDERFFTTLLATMAEQPGITETEVIDLWYLSDAPED